MSGSHTAEMSLEIFKVTSLCHKSNFYLTKTTGKNKKQASLHWPFLLQNHHLDMSMIIIHVC